MVWLRNTVVEVRREHLNMFEDKLDAVQYALACHFGEDVDVSVWATQIKVGDQIVDSQVKVSNEPFKIIFEENPVDYFGNCVAKTLNPVLAELV